MVASNPSEPAKVASQEVSTKKEEYRKISKSEIPEKDKEEHALSEALKFIPDCDIYEKIDDYYNRVCTPTYRVRHTCQS